MKFSDPHEIKETSLIKIDDLGGDSFEIIGADGNIIGRVATYDDTVLFYNASWMLDLLQRFRSGEYDDEEFNDELGLLLTNFKTQ